MSTAPNILVRNKFYRGAGKAGRGAKAIASKLNRHFKYLEHRPKEGQETREDRAIFNSQSDHITRREAVDDVMAHRCNRVDYHHLLLSPDPQEPVADLREWTRNIMKDFEEFSGKQLHWYAVQHHNTVSHPHVHVVIAGAGEVKGKAQLQQPVTIFEPERTLLHASALEHSDHELYRLMDEQHDREMQELAQEPPAYSDLLEHTVLDWRER